MRRRATTSASTRSSGSTAGSSRAADGPLAGVIPAAIDAVPDMKLPILGLFGGDDAGIPVETVTQFDEALDAGGPDARDRRVPRRAALVLRPQVRRARRRVRRRLAPRPGLPFRRRGATSARVSAAACAASWSSQPSSPPRSARAAPAVAAESTATGTGGAAVERRRAGHAGRAARPCATAATPSTPRSPRPASSASSSRSPPASAAAASWSSAPQDGKVTTIDSRETAPAAMTPTSFFANGAPLEFDDARLQRAVGRRAGHGARLGPRAARRTGRGRWATRCARHPRRAATASPSTRRSPGRSRTTQSRVRAGPVHRGDLPRSRRHAARCRLDAAQPGSRRDVRGDRRRTAPTRSTPARSPQSIVDAVDAPPVAAGPEVFQPGVMTTARPRRATSALERDPTHSQFRGLDVYGMGPPSSGGTTVGEILNILDGTDLGGGDRAKALHLFMEASALAYADRGAYLADPAYVDVPVAGLLSPEFAAVRRALIDPAATAPRPVQAGDPLPYDDAPPPVTVPTIQRTGSTTHLTVADADGNVVSYTFTIEQIGGNAIVVPGRGFLLNNELTDFSIDDPDGAEPRRGRQAAALVDGADDRRARRRAAPRARVAGRRDDHHHGRPGALRPPRARLAAAGRDGGAARVRAQHRGGRRRARLHRLARGPGAGVDRTATSSTRSTRSAPSPASSGWATAGCSPRRSRCAAEAGPPGW